MFFNNGLDDQIYKKEKIFRSSDIQGKDKFRLFSLMRWTNLTNLDKIILINFE